MVETKEYREKICQLPFRTLKQ